MKTPISKNFNYEDFEFSQEANEHCIDNHITSDKVRFAIRLLVLNLLEPLQSLVNHPLILSSGYRCPELNKAIGGAKNSQHLIGEASDIRCGSALEVLHLAQIVKRHGLPFDQMILYGSFLHLSFKANGKQRHQILYDKSYKEAQL